MNKAKQTAKLKKLGNNYYELLKKNKQKFYDSTN
jgi:hypothetical protein